METTIQRAYSVSQIAKLDQECKQLVAMFSSARIKIGLELAQRLKEFEDKELYKKLDETAYQSFNDYLRSLNINYKTAREIIGIYETFVLVAGMTIDELAQIAYHKLTTIKPMLFKKQHNEYNLVVPKDDVRKWVADAQSDITQEDLAQKRREHEAGEHEHNFIKLQVCTICKLKEQIG